MLMHKRVVVTGVGAITLETVVLQKQNKGNQALIIDSIVYASRVFTSQSPIEVGVYYGDKHGVLVEQDIHDYTDVYASTTLGRCDVWHEWVKPEDRLVTNRDEIGLYVRKSSDAIESIVFMVHYEEVKLTDVQLITLNRSRGYSTLPLLFSK